MTTSMTPILSDVNSVSSSSLTDKETQQIISWVKSEYAKIKGAKSTITRQWYYNLSMYYGKQYYSLLDLRNGNKMMSTPKAPKGVVRQTINLIRPMIRSEIARMTSQKPTATAIPATTSDNDMFAAQGAEQIWEFLQQRRKFHQKMMRNAFWTTITGTGFMKTWWDSGLDKDTALLADSDPMRQLFAGQPAVGDVLMDVVTPFNLFIPDLLEQDIENQPFVIEAYTRPVTWVERFWPQVGGKVKPDVASRNEIIETTFFNVADSENTKPDSVLVLECWVKPGGSPVLPEGGLITIAGNELVQPPTRGMPYSHGEFPYTKFEHIPTGTFYGDSVLIDINHLQREYNRTRSGIVEAKSLQMSPQMMVPEGAMDVNKWTRQPGLIVTYKPGFTPPTPIQVQPLPAYILQEQDRIKADMEDISGQHSVTKGGTPGGGITAATAISFLQERDDSIMGPTYASIEAGTEKIARQALSLVVDYYDLPRIIEATGLDQSFDSLELKGSDVKNGINIRVEGGSALPTSKAARQALLMDMAKMGFISPDQMLDMMDIGGIGKLTERLRIDMRQAQRENLRMKRLTPEQIAQHEMQLLNSPMPEIDPNTGFPTYDPTTPATYPPMIPVNDYDNHQVHITTHNDYRKSQEFEMQDPAVKEQFAKHVEMHMNALMMSMQTPQGGMIPPGMFGQAGGMTNTEPPQQGNQQPLQAMPQEGGPNANNIQQG